MTAGVTAFAVGAFALPAATAAPEQAASRDRGYAAGTVQQVAPGTMHSRVNGTFGRAGPVRGNFVPDRFFVRGGETFANGVLRATLRRGNGDLVGSVQRRITIPVRAGHVSDRGAAGAVALQQECDILNLVLGPLDLNLLGLEVHLNRVVLDIVAVRGAGNLLGNLLCAVAGLLDGTGVLNELRLSNLLNRILALLRV
ncbi:MAG TPA: ABC transporter substrate-binding protein [Actinomycetota bacterium]|nr:ABC transporter substrate-binding protein [Actinomycetota bacterium]